MPSQPTNLAIPALLIRYLARNRQQYGPLRVGLERANTCVEPAAAADQVAGLAERVLDAEPRVRLAYFFLELEYAELVWDEQLELKLFSARGQASPAVWYRLAADRPLDLLTCD